MNDKKTKQKEIICLHTHRNRDILLATMRSSPRKKLHVKRASKCDYMIFSFNRNSALYLDYSSSVRQQGLTEIDYPNEMQTSTKQDEGFMICKISGIYKLSKNDHPNIHPEAPFHAITFKEHASIEIPLLYENKKNPVSYFSENQILKLLNIKDFDELEWSQENNLEPVFDDPKKYEVDYQNHIEEQNYLVQLYRDDLSSFLDREMNEIIGSEVYIDGSDFELSRNLFVTQKKKEYEAGMLDIEIPKDICNKDGQVIERLQTFEDWASHTFWMMHMSNMTVKETIKYAKDHNIKDMKAVWPEMQNIAKAFGVVIERLEEEWNEETDIDLGGLSFEFYKLDDTKELSIEQAKIGLSKKYDIPIDNIEVILKG